MLISAQSEFTNVIDATPFGGWLARCEPWEWGVGDGPREAGVVFAPTPHTPPPTPIQSANRRTLTQDQEKNGQGALPRHSQRGRRDHLAFAIAARPRHPA